MKSIINLSGSKSVSRAFKRGRRRSKNRRLISSTNTIKHEIPTNVNICENCDNAGYETSDKVAACNCCENYEFYTPMKKSS